MRKTPRSFSLLCACCLLFFNVSNVFAQQPPELAPRLADYIVQYGHHSHPKPFNTGLSDEGVMYELKFFIGSELHQATVFRYNSGARSLSLDYYLTNQVFDEWSSPAEFVAYELMYGVPKVYVEVHMLDNNVDGVAEVYQEFTNKKGSIYEGFTRRERDTGEKSGVDEILFMNGEVYREKRFWRDRFESASEKEKAEVQEAYKELLSKLADYLGLT